jgi:hypothetical protein
VHLHKLKIYTRSFHVWTESFDVTLQENIGNISTNVSASRDMILSLDTGHKN